MTFTIIMILTTNLFLIVLFIVHQIILKRTLKNVNIFGIESIDKGQYEAARALNMDYLQTMRRIILPQVVRRTIPPTCNEAITLVKDTALVVVIGMGDLLRSAKELFSRDFAITPFAIAAVIYLLMTTVIVYFFRKLEDKYSIYE